MSLCHTKFHGSEPIYEGLVGEYHLAAMCTEQAYRDTSRMPTATILDPDDYCALSGDGGRPYQGHDPSTKTKPSRNTCLVSVQHSIVLVR